MKKYLLRLVSVLSITMALTAALFLASCAPSANDGDGNNSALTWGTFGSYGQQENFFNLLRETYPDIELELISNQGANRTEYSWAQMRANDIPDIFITSQILDTELARERLIDLSGYDFINNISTAGLDQVSIDGGIYLLPCNYAMYGIFYNKTLMQEKGWEVPANFAELEALCEEIRAEGMIPGIVGTQLTGGPFSNVFNLAKTDWLTTPEGAAWERDFLNGDASAEGMWEDTMDYIQQYIDIGMFTTDPEDQNNSTLIENYLGGRKAVFCITVSTVGDTTIPNSTDELGMMPYIGKDGSKNVYMYSPSFYFGISSRLAEPGNEEKLENAVRIMSLLFSEEGQAAFISDTSPCVMSVLNSASLPEDALIYDAQQALWSGRAFPMTYAHWDGVLSDMGQAYKEWFRGENGMDGTQCILRMDELMQNSLENADMIYFSESTADFTLEETAGLVGKALGAAADADAVMVPLGEFHEGGIELPAGLTCRLYAGPINSGIANTICPAKEGEYAVMTMTGAQAKTLAQTGLFVEGDSRPFPYLLVTRKDQELDDDTVYRIAFLMEGYTDETAQTYSAEVYAGSIRSIVHDYLAGQKVVSPDGNPWE